MIFQDLGDLLGTGGLWLWLASAWIWLLVGFIIFVIVPIVIVFILSPKKNMTRLWALFVFLGGFIGTIGGLIVFAIWLVIYIRGSDKPCEEGINFLPCKEKV